MTENDWMSRALAAEARIADAEAQLAARAAYDLGMRAAKRGDPFNSNPYSEAIVCGWSLRLSWSAGYGAVIEDLVPDDRLAPVFARMWSGAFAGRIDGRVFR